MKNVKLFGLLEHSAFYGIIIFTILAIASSDFLFAYLAIICWLLSLLAHFAESRLEGRDMRKVLVGI